MVSTYRRPLGKVYQDSLKQKCCDYFVSFNSNISHSDFFNMASNYLNQTDYGSCLCIHVEYMLTVCK